MADEHKRVMLLSSPCRLSVLLSFLYGRLLCVGTLLVCNFPFKVHFISSKLLANTPFQPKQRVVQNFQTYNAFGCTEVFLFGAPRLHVLMYHVQ